MLGHNSYFWQGIENYQILGKPDFLEIQYFHS